MNDAEKLSDYDYDLPQELIAQHPIEQRDHSRLMVLDRKTGAITHSHFYELPGYVQPGDVMVLNDTKVVHARLCGERATGGRIEALILQRREGGCHEVLLKPSARLKIGERVTFEEDRVAAHLRERTDEGSWIVEFEEADSLDERLAKTGRVPLPPYIKRTYPDDEHATEDAERYQTVYSRSPGAIAAPTAGLHFTEELQDRVASRGVPIRYVTLHVGRGTFRPVTEEDLAKHRLDAEYFAIPQDTADQVNQAKDRQRRVIAVGTTTTRALETAGAAGKLLAMDGWTEKFITPPYSFRIVDALVTNFHLPKSSLLLLVSAFAGREQILDAYRQAIEKKYRFYSYGDAMLIL